MECKVVLEGITPMLQNRKVLEKAETMKKHWDPEAEARKALHTDAEGRPIVPEEYLRKMFVEVVKGLKLPSNKKLALKEAVPSDLQIIPSQIPIEPGNWVVDIRPVNIRGNSILRARPRFDEWKISFTIKWEPQYLGKDFPETILRPLLERAGISKGLGDYRPGKGPGTYGRFRIVSIQ